MTRRARGETGPDAGDLVLYFAADRIATNGDAQIGFWFLQDDVAPDGLGGFTGEHTDGDILILSDFTKGGTIGTIEVCTWVGTGIAGHLESEGPNDKYAKGAFFEGGVNATKLLGTTPCFASFLVETRSSQSLDAGQPHPRRGRARPRRVRDLRRHVPADDAAGCGGRPHDRSELGRVHRR